MIIDCHTHCYPAEVVADPAAWARHHAEKHWADLVAPSGRVSIQGWASPEQMLQAMDEAGVETAVLLGWYWENEATCRWHNEVIAQWCASAPQRFLGYAAVFPNERVIEQLESARALGLRGVGELHPGVQSFHSDSPAWCELADWCARHHWPVNFHTSRTHGDHPAAVATPMEDYLAMIGNHPSVKFVFAHWGADLPQLLRKAPPAHVYYDCSASPLLYGMAHFRRVIDLVGAEQVLYGSDYPLRIYPRKEKRPEMRRFIDQIREEAGLSEAETEKLFCHNFQTLHPMIGLA